MAGDKRERLKGLYFILNLGPGGFNDIPLWLEGLFANGIRLIQVRGKGIHPLKLTAITSEIIDMAERYNAEVIVNDFPDVALETGAFGVHLGLGDASIKEGRDIVGPHAAIGVTVRNIKGAVKAINSGADYIAVGSIFKSPTKPRAPLVGLNTLVEIRKEFPDVPLCAIGGIDASNILSVREAGVDMVAVVSAIAGSRNPEREAFSLSAAFTRPLPDVEECMDEFNHEELED